MIRRLAFAAARLSSAVVFVLTWAYGVTTYSPFAFDMFIGPRLFPGLAAFVVWHHLWYWGAFLLSAATLVGNLGLLPSRPAPSPVVRWASLGFLVVFGFAGVYLTVAPQLASMGTGSHNLVVVPGALFPLLWLAVIDHLSGRIDGAAKSTIGQGRLLTACLGAGAFLWAAHLVRAWLSVDTALVPWLLAAAWALALDLTVFLFVYVVLNLTSTLAATRAKAFAWEYGLGVLVTAVAAMEFFRRIVFPTLSISGADAAVISVPLGAVLALMWSGFRLRSARGRVEDDETGIDLLWSLPRRHRTANILWLVVVSITASLALALIARIDWASTLHRLVAVMEAMAVFGVFLNLSRRRQGVDWSLGRLVAAPLLALMAVHAMPFVATRLVATTGDGRLDAQAMIDRYDSTDGLASVAATQLIERQAGDATFFRQLLNSESSQPMLRPVAPADALAPSLVPLGAPPPNVFVFVIDSLRRDYLSPYNPVVTFTPAIDGWARENYVFRNAFTQYGGTWLAAPSIWTGSAITRGWANIFQQQNAIEPLIKAAGYDFVINDFAVEAQLRKDTRRTFLNPYVASPQTDFCQGLASLESHLDRRTVTAPPVFAYLSPMNVHIINTMTGSTEPDPRYPGFHAPYASRLERIDACFGSFVSHLKERGLYDNSVVILTSDHGDSLGNEGQWGHQLALFPEVVRVPLIIHLPAGNSLTADLGRETFLMDIAPTLLTLLGQPVRELGPLYGSPLFVPPDQEPKPRRRESFMVMSSYGSTFGVLRRNGRFLYVSDLANFREYAYALLRGPLGERVAVSDALRHVNQTEILEDAERVNAHYRQK